MSSFTERDQAEDHILSSSISLYKKYIFKEKKKKI